MGLGAWCVQRCSLTHLKLDLAQVRGRALRHMKILPAVAGSGGSPLVCFWVFGFSFGGRSVGRSRSLCSSVPNSSSIYGDVLPPRVVAA